MNPLANKIINKDIEEVVKNIGLKRLQKFDNTTICITGAGGFVGTHLCLFFLYLKKRFKIKVEIIACINSSTILSSELEDLYSHKIRIIRKDLVSSTLNIKSRLDYVFHLISITSPKTILSKPIYSIDSNVFSLKNMFDSISSKGVKKIIYLSSSAVYGNCRNAVSEKSNGNLSSISEIAPYAEAKKLCETICFAYNKEKGIPVSVIRPFHLFGPLMDLKKDIALNYFLNCGLERKKIILQSRGDAIRSYCYISDAMTIMLLISLLDSNFEIFNLGNQKNTIKIVDLANKVSGLFTYPVDVTYGNTYDAKKIDAIKVSVPSMSKVKKLLNFSPKIGLDEGLARIIHSYELN